MLPPSGRLWCLCRCSDSLWLWRARRQRRPREGSRSSGSRGASQLAWPRQGIRKRRTQASWRSPWSGSPSTLMLARLPAWQNAGRPCRNGQSCSRGPRRVRLWLAAQPGCLLDRGAASVERRRTCLCTNFSGLAGGTTGAPGRDTPPCLRRDTVCLLPSTSTS